MKNHSSRNKPVTMFMIDQVNSIYSDNIRNLLNELTARGRHRDVGLLKAYLIDMYQNLQEYEPSIFWASLKKQVINPASMFNSLSFIPVNITEGIFLQAVERKIFSEQVGPYIQDIEFLEESYHDLTAERLMSNIKSLKRLANPPRFNFGGATSELIYVSSNFKQFQERNKIIHDCCKLKGIHPKNYFFLCYHLDISSSDIEAAIVTKENWLQYIKWRSNENYSSFLNRVERFNKKGYHITYINNSSLRLKYIIDVLSIH